MTDPATGSPALAGPVRSVRNLVRRGGDPLIIAGGAAVGAIVAALPLVGFRRRITSAVCASLGLSSASARLVGRLGTPPLIQIVSILAGHYVRRGGWLTAWSGDGLVRQAGQILLEWLIGSLVVGPVLGLVFGAVFYGVARSARTAAGGS